jgi:hypothetical protein
MGALCEIGVDECTAGTADCGADATCTHTAGSFTCACNPGFTRDGAETRDAAAAGLAVLAVALVQRRRARP